MKNIPEKIYLQLGEDVGEDFKDHHEVSWCVDKIYDTDLEYVSINQVTKLTAERDQYQKEAIAAKIKVEKMKLMNTEIKSAEEILEKIKQRFLSAYYAGFNQAHYSHMHPESFEVKECESAGEEYMSKNEKYIDSDLEEYASQFKQPDISENVLQELGEKEVMIKAFADIQDMFEKRYWIMEGRGCYPYNDDRYKEEMRYLYDDFCKLKKDIWKNIKTKTFEYRDKIIESYKSQQHVPTVDEDKDEDEFWNKVGAILNGSVSFSMYPEYLATLKQQFSITRK